MATVMLPSEAPLHPDPLSDERQEQIVEMVYELKLARFNAEELMQLAGPSSHIAMAAGARYHSIQQRLTALLMEEL